MSCLTELSYRFVSQNDDAMDGGELKESLLRPPGVEYAQVDKNNRWVFIS